MGIPEFIVIAYLFGAVVAIPYGAQMMSVESVILSLLALYSLPLPLIFYALEKIEDKKDKKIIRQVYRITNASVKAGKKSTEWLTKRFHGRESDIIYFIALGFLSFALGFLVAAAAAYALEIKKKIAYPSIMIGTLAGIVFWSYITLYSLRDVSPYTFVAITLSISVASLAYGKVREMRTLRKIKKRRQKV
jgi:hypothetical protein